MVYATKPSSSNHLFKQKSLKFCFNFNFPDLYFILSLFLFKLYIHLNLIINVGNKFITIDETNLMKTTKMNLSVYKSKATRCVNCSIAVY